MDFLRMETPGNIVAVKIGPLRPVGVGQFFGLNPFDVSVAIEYVAISCMTEVRNTAAVSSIIVTFPIDGSSETCYQRNPKGHG